MKAAPASTPPQLSGATVGLGSIGPLRPREGRRPGTRVNVAPAGAAAGAPTGSPGAPELRAAAVGLGSIGPLRPRRAMLVDDESALRRLGARMLERLGVPTDVCADGTEVAEALTPAHELLLLDIVVRHSDGAVVRARVRA